MQMNALRTKQVSHVGSRDITVCMAQHRRILRTACGRHQSSSPVAIFALPTRVTLLVPPTRRVTLGDRALSVVAARAWNSLPAQTLQWMIHRPGLRVGNDGSGSQKSNTAVC